MKCVVPHSFIFSSAYDEERRERVALKKLARPFQSETHAKHCYRELKLLSHFHHDNVCIVIGICFTHSTYINATYHMYHRIISIMLMQTFTFSLIFF